MNDQEFIPLDHAKNVSWEIEERQSSDNSRDGSGWIVDFEGPIWRVKFQFENMTQAAMRKLDAFGIRRQGKLSSFTCTRPDRKAPLLHPTFSNSGLTLASVDAGAMTVSLTGVSPSGAQITEGDMFSYKTAKNGFYVGVVTSSVAASGGSVTLGVYPPPLPPHVSTPTPRLANAIGEFQLDSAWNPNEPVDRRRGITFTAKQVVRL